MTQVTPSRIGAKLFSKKVCFSIVNSNSIFIDISKMYQFGKILGIGTFGLIREAVLISSV
jgi:hypothetical protein